MSLKLISCFAQQDTLRGQVFETFSKTPIPFAHININEGTIHAFSDIDGKFAIPLDTTITQITVSQYLHRTVQLSSPIKNDSLIINLNKNEYFIFNSSSDPIAESIIKKVLTWKNFNNFRGFKNYSYATYNKLSFSSGENKSTNNYLKTASKILPLKLKEFKEQQHFLLVETVTEKKFHNTLNQIEIITGAKSSGVNVPSLLLQTTQLQFSSVYDNFFNIKGKPYISPLSGNPFEGYAFNLIDSINSLNHTTYVIKFNPLPNKNFDGLKGILFINTQFYGVKYFITSPANENQVSTNIYQAFQLHNGNAWFPYQNKTEVISYKGIAIVNFKATMTSYIKDVRLNQELDYYDFDETILKLPPFADQREEAFWQKNRTVPLTIADSNTYQYFSENDSKKRLQEVLQLGERVYYGFIPLGKVNLDLTKVLHFNEVEGVRLGLGLYTNEKLWTNKSVGGYLGYGTKDQRFKFGGNFSYQLQEDQNLRYNFALYHDLREAGAVNFAFDRYQFSSESLRLLRLRILDLVTEVQNSITMHPLKYLDLHSGVNFSHNRPTYSYNYRGESKSFQFTELQLGGRYAFGEQFVQIPSKKFSLGTKYPVVYAQVTQGINFGWGNFNYSKFDWKVEESIKILKIGISTFQLIGGITRGDAPYMKLYNGRGSLKRPSVVIHNSFETMRYNEFLSDRYIAFFYTHNFGRIIYQHKNIQPSLSIMHNVGIGSLKNSGVHEGLPIDFRTMEKGYVETGLFLDNVLVFKLTGLNTGIGAGFFYRYGPYASLKGSENVVFKFSLNFGI